jgi:hypothetical protein
MKSGTDDGIRGLGRNSAEVQGQLRVMTTLFAIRHALEIEGT